LISVVTSDKVSSPPSSMLAIVSSGLRRPPGSVIQVKG
jgi:hypothetical protein